MGIFPGPMCTSCFVSERGTWHEVGVCGLQEAVFQLTGSASSYKMGIQLDARNKPNYKVGKAFRVILIVRSSLPGPFSPFTLSTQLCISGCGSVKWQSLPL